MQTAVILLWSLIVATQYILMFLMVEITIIFKVQKTDYYFIVYGLFCYMNWINWIKRKNLIMCKHIYSVQIFF